MAALLTEQWIKFFQQAGIPDKAAATYALTFAENRIQMNMLLDLNKEYLRDMGITLMGDVIAILRHARAKHEEIAREKLLVTSDREKPAVLSKAVEVVPMNVSKPTVSAKKLPSASQLCTRDVASVAAATKSKPKIPTKEPDVCSKTYPRKVSMTQPEIAVPAKSKSKLSFSTVETRTIEDDRSIKKARRVAPEEEGAYKIKMPSGTTPRSQEILEKSKELARRRNVFQRLGSETTSSISNGTRSPPSSTPAVSSTTGAITITGLSTAVSKKIAKPTGESTGFHRKSQSSSVFQRLGDKQVSSVSSSTQSIGKREKALPYAGVIRSTSPEKITKRIVTQKPIEGVTMVADSVDSARTEVRERLGSFSRKSSRGEFPPKVERKRSVPDLLNCVGIKSRLGESKLISDKLERESTVRERLKVPSVRSNARVSPYSTSVVFEKNKQNNRGVFSRLSL